jgi:hypothetical protein
MLVGNTDQQSRRRITGAWSVTGWIMSLGLGCAAMPVGPATSFGQDSFQLDPIVDGGRPYTVNDVRGDCGKGCGGTHASLFCDSDSTGHCIPYSAHRLSIRVVSIRDQSSSDGHHGDWIDIGDPKIRGEVGGVLFRPGAPANYSFTSSL